MSDGPFYVVEEAQAIVVAGPFDDPESAKADARERTADYIVTTKRVLDMMETAEQQTVRWENDDGDVDLVTDGGKEVESEIPKQDWIEDLLESLGMVQWDRFVQSEGPDLGVYFDIYGWIDREQDSYKDFLLLRVFPETDDNLRMFTTSSDRYHEEINEIVFGENVDSNHCQRVEHTFDISNVVEKEVSEAATDGGTRTVRSSRYNSYPSDLIVDAREDDDVEPFEEECPVTGEPRTVVRWVEVDDPDGGTRTIALEHRGDADV